MFETRLLEKVRSQLFRRHPVDPARLSEGGQLAITDCNYSGSIKQLFNSLVTRFEQILPRPLHRVPTAPKPP
jgi:hypothetical protein